MLRGFFTDADCPRSSFSSGTRAHHHTGNTYPNGLGYWEAHRSARVEALNGPRTQDPRWPGWDGTARLAVEQWKQAEPDYLLVAGPATNIAYAVEHAPEVLSGCTVVFMAGLSITQVTPQKLPNGMYGLIHTPCGMPWKIGHVMRRHR